MLLKMARHMRSLKGGGIERIPLFHAVEDWLSGGVGAQFLKGIQEELLQLSIPSDASALLDCVSNFQGIVLAQGLFIRVGPTEAGRVSSRARMKRREWGRRALEVVDLVKSRVASKRKALVGSKKPVVNTSLAEKLVYRRGSRM